MADAVVCELQWHALAVAMQRQPAAAYAIAVVPGPQHLQFSDQLKHCVIHTPSTDVTCMHAQPLQHAHNILIPSIWSTSSAEVCKLTYRPLCSLCSA